MNNNILNTKNLTIGYASKKEVLTITSDINISLTKGKLITLIGGNGIGKSTLLRTITAIQTPISGDVILNNKNLFSIDRLGINCFRKTTLYKLDWNLIRR
jgi:iron complex transport system ATP-binding protein